MQRVYRRESEDGDAGGRKVWQYAAQGLDGREYPWGSAWVAANVPAVDTGRQMLAASDVGRHTQGASPFGVQDLVGNVW